VALYCILSQAGRLSLKKREHSQLSVHVLAALLNPSG
jgi:hypothetical protein